VSAFRKYCVIRNQLPLLIENQRKSSSDIENNNNGIPKELNVESLLPQYFSTLKVLKLNEKENEINEENIEEELEQSEITKIWWKAIEIAGYKHPSRSDVVRAIEQIKSLNEKDEMNKVEQQPVRKKQKISDEIMITEKQSTTITTTDIIEEISTPFLSLMNEENNLDMETTSEIISTTTTTTTPIEQQKAIHNSLFTLEKVFSKLESTQSTELYSEFQNFLVNLVSSSSNNNSDFYNSLSRCLRDPKQLQPLRNLSKIMKF